MSITVFLAFCILGCDFLLYALFQWVYGEKRRKRAHLVVARSEKRRTSSSNASEAGSVVAFPERAMQYRTGFF